MENKKCHIILNKTQSTLNSITLSLGNVRGRDLTLKRIKQDILLFHLLIVQIVLFNDFL